MLTHALMKKKLVNIWLIIVTLILHLSSVLYAQNLGAYELPYPSFQQKKSVILKDDSEVLAFVQDAFPSHLYPNVGFSLLHKNESLGAIHYTFQMYYKDFPLEQVQSKVHVQKNSQKLLLWQSNMPNEFIWKLLSLNTFPSSSAEVALFEKDQLIIAKKTWFINELSDEYAQHFTLPNGSYYENVMKYHIDTTAYAKVFVPDPLTRANQNYGGFYQDGFEKDTTNLLIQAINNPGGATIAAPATNFTFDGQTFNVTATSYPNNFANPIVYQMIDELFLDGQGSVLGYTTALSSTPSTFVSTISYEDYNYPNIAAQQVWRTMPVDFSGGTFNVSNDYFIISEFSLPFTNPATSITDTFLFTRNQLEFEDVNAFYHLNAYKAYWESIGFNNLAPEALLVDAHGNNGADNSFFSPTSPPRLVFGQGGVDDAEDADVIVHEYGHAISNFASPGSNISDQRRALDEGFGDYLASSYSKQFSNFNSDFVFSWDGHNEFWGGRINNATKTKADLSSAQNIYYNGEIWSATLMDLRAELGGTITDQLAIEVMYYNLPNTTMQEAAENLFVADTAIFNGVYSCEIFDVLLARKFLLGTCQDFYSGIGNQAIQNENISLQNTEGFSFRNENLILHITDEDIQEASLQVYDSQGKWVKTIHVDQGSQALLLNELQAGVYFLHIGTPKGFHQFKIVKTQ